MLDAPAVLAASIRALLVVHYAIIPRQERFLEALWRRLPRISSLRTALAVTAALADLLCLIRPNDRAVVRRGRPCTMRMS
jgi:hypothetical protein